MPDRPPPPAPINPNDPMWIGRAWQWVFDSLTHQDTCTDETKEMVVKAVTMIQQNAELFNDGLNEVRALTASGDATLTEAFKKHRDFHDVMEREAKARSSVWKMQGAIVSKVFRIGTEGAVLGAVALVLKLIGVL